MTEVIGYDGPIYMTHPTKAICPILLVGTFHIVFLYLQEDYRKINVERRGDQNFFTSDMIYRCMTKVRCVYIHQTVKVTALIFNFESLKRLMMISKYRHFMLVTFWEQQCFLYV